MRSWGIWLTAFVRGVQLETLTDFSRGTTVPISYTQCYKYVVGLAKRSFLILNRWCGWNRLPAPTSPTITYNGLYMKRCIFNLKEQNYEYSRFRT
jgi:hypothetical protein